MHTIFGVDFPCRGAGCFQCGYEDAITRWTTTTERSADARRAVMAEFIEPALRLCPSTEDESTWIDNPPDTPVYTTGKDMFRYACKLLHQERTGVVHNFSRLCAHSAPHCGFLRDKTLSPFAKLYRLAYHVAHTYSQVTYTMDPVTFVRAQYLAWGGTPLTVLRLAISPNADNSVEKRLHMFMAAGDDDSVHNAFQGLRADMLSAGSDAAVRTLDNLHAAVYRRRFEIALALHSHDLNADVASAIALPARFLTPFDAVAPWAGE